jgi:hypothetical protein
MMKSRLTNTGLKPIRQLALGGALGLIGLATLLPGAARAQDSGDNTLFGSVLKGLGIGGENHIEYHERPPLVVPPTRELPPPQTAGTARGPNWPADPKSAARKKGDQIRDLDKLPVPERAAAPSMVPGGPDTTAAVPPSQPAGSGGFFGNLFSSSERPAATPMPTTPARNSLIQPPLDYEAPAPSQPYGSATPAAPAKTTPESALQTQPGSPGL